MGLPKKPLLKPWRSKRMTREEVLKLIGEDDRPTITTLCMLHYIIPTLYKQNSSNLEKYKLLRQLGFINAYTEQEIFDDSEFTYKKIVPKETIYLLFNPVSYSRHFTDFENKYLFENSNFLDYCDAEFGTIYAFHLDIPEYQSFRNGKYSELQSIIPYVSDLFISGVIMKTEEARQGAEEFYKIPFTTDMEYFKIQENILKIKDDDNN